MRVEILGGGCANCKKLEENVRAALAKKGVNAEVVKVTDFGEIASYGVLRTPALAIDGKVVAEGRIPSVEEIAKML
ncbi:MAG: thioredoxin family protein [Candidatus Micrarchaeia archaeon]